MEERKKLNKLIFLAAFPSNFQFPGREYTTILKTWGGYNRIKGIASFVEPYERTSSSGELPIRMRARGQKADGPSAKRGANRSGDMQGRQGNER